MLWKTKVLETTALVSDLPARFSLVDSYWGRLRQITVFGFWFSLMLVAINTLHFLMMRVPL